MTSSCFIRLVLGAAQTLVVAVGALAERGLAARGGHASVRVADRLLEHVGVLEKLAID